MFKLLVCLGLIGLAAITLQDPATSVMYATPWRFCYWALVAIPPLLLFLQINSRPDSFFTPTTSWLSLLGSAAVTLLAAAWFSPYRAACLQWTALPLSGLACFLVIHDWLQRSPANRVRLADCLAFAASAVVITSTAYWVGDLASLTRSQLFSAEVFAMRNPHPLGHANYSAGLALLSLPWLFAAAFRRAGFPRCFFAASAALALLMLFTSGSRGGMLGLAALALAGVGATGLGRRKLAIGAIGAVTAVVILAVANPRIRSLLGPRDDSVETNVSTVQRTAMIEAGIAMAIDRPVFGWGNGSTPLAFPRFRRVVEGGAENVLQLHSTPIEILATNGLPGFLIAGIFLSLSFRGSFRAPTAAIALASYTAFSLTDFQLDVPIFVFSIAALASQLAAPGNIVINSPTRTLVNLSVVGVAALITIFGQRDPTPALNAEALSLAKDPGQTARAIALLNRSLELNPDQEIAHFNLGWLLVVSDPAGAEKHFFDAMRLVPDKGGVYFGIGLARLNQGDNAGAARGFACECLNEPQFIASPWWKLPPIAARRAETAAIFSRLTRRAAEGQLTHGWVNRQAINLAGLADSLGLLPAGSGERNYRRVRAGYPVLMRNLDIAPPIDLYDVREDPSFTERLPFPLPHKGWLPTPVLDMLINEELFRQ